MAMKEKNNDKIIGYIYETFDYGKFGDIPTNRKINETNYAKLVNSMKEEALNQLVMVNEHFQIIDGQHMFKARKEMGLPILYRIEVGYSTSQMKRANLVSAVWKKEDFLHAFVEDKCEHYIEFEKIKNNCGLNINDLLKIISEVRKKGFKPTETSFEKGSLEITKEDKEKINKFLKELEDFSSFDYYKRSSFIKAFLSLHCFDGYDHSQMQSKLKTKGKLLEKKTSKAEYLELLANKIYSYGTTKNSIFYHPERDKLYIP